MSGNPRRLLPRPSASGDRDSAGLPDHDHRSQQHVDQRTDPTHISNVGRTRHPASESTVVLPPMRLHPPQGSTAQRPPTSSQGRSQDPPHYQPQSSGPALIGAPAQLETHRAMRQEVAAQQPAAYVSPYGSTQPHVGGQQPAAYVSPYGSTQPDNEGQQLQPMTKQRPPWTDEQDEDLLRYTHKWPYARSEEVAKALNNGHDADDCRKRRIVLKQRYWVRGKAEEAKAKKEADRKTEDKPSGKKT